MSNEKKIDQETDDNWLDDIPEGGTVSVGRVTLNDGTRCTEAIVKENGGINYYVETHYGYMDKEELEAKGLIGDKEFDYQSVQGDDSKIDANETDEIKKLAIIWLRTSVRLGMLDYGLTAEEVRNEVKEQTHFIEQQRHLCGEACNEDASSV